MNTVPGLQAWLQTLPIQDPVDRKMAGLLQFILLGFMVIVLTAGVLNLTVVRSSIPWQAQVVRVIITLLIIGVPLYLVRRGKYRLSAGMIIALLLFVMAYALTLGTLREIAETLSFLTLAIFMAGLLVGRRALAVTFFLSAGIVVWGVVQEQQAGVDMGGNIIAFNFVLLNGLMSLFLGRFRRALRNALADAQERETALQQEIRERQMAEAENIRLNAELEQRVLERTTQLEAANQELEAFTYTVSHDLRAPLRGIHGFSNILQDEYAGQLDGIGQRYLQQIIGNSHRMSELIDALLAFSRLGRQKIRKETISPAQLLQEVLFDLQPILDERQVAVDIAHDLPDCEADPALLRQIFANLLSNALKYSRVQEKARIEVNWLEENGEVIYFVRDNGAGFDMQYADKLFGVFQRLHRQDEFEGHGVGLATVARIVERHGGRIWGEGEVDRGATFYFTLERDAVAQAEELG